MAGAARRGSGVDVSRDPSERERERERERTLLDLFGGNIDLLFFAQKRSHLPGHRFADSCQLTCNVRKTDACNVRRGGCLDPRRVQREQRLSDQYLKLQERVDARVDARGARCMLR